MVRFDPKSLAATLLCAASLNFCLLTAFADDEKAKKAEAPQPTPAEQALGLEQMCIENAEAMAKRQAEKSLYERLGGAEKIHELVTEVVRLHDENPALKSSMEGVDRPKLIQSVADFIVTGTGGPDVYKGQDMVKAHAHMGLTNAHFMSAGGDVMQAMKNKGYAEPEIQEMVCTLVALREQVVIESEKKLK